MGCVKRFVLLFRACSCSNCMKTPEKCLCQTLKIRTQSISTQVNRRSKGHVPDRAFCFSNLRWSAFVGIQWWLRSSASVMVSVVSFPVELAAAEIQRSSWGHVFSTESSTHVLLQPWALLSPVRLCLGVIFGLQADPVLSTWVVFLLLSSKAADYYSGDGGRISTHGTVCRIYWFSSWECWSCCCCSNSCSNSCYGQESHCFYGDFLEKLLSISVEQITVLF